MSLKVLRKNVAQLSDLINGGMAVFPFGVGKQYFLDPTNGSDGNDGTAPDKAFKTLPVAYAALTANQNDVLFYIPGTSSISLSAAFTWAKSYTHFVGLSAPTRAGQRARIFQTASATGLSPLITISGSGCVWANLYIFQGVNDATSLIDVSVTGSRNYFQNVHFAGGGHATQAVDGGASLHISGGSENTFEGCTIGVDTIAAGTGMAGLVYAATGGAARNRFIDCDFTMYAGHAGAIFVELLGNSGLDRYHEFVDCRFINLASTTMTQAFAVAAGFDPANKRILLSGNYAKIGCTKWDDGDTGLIYGGLSYTSAADAVGNYVQVIT